MANLKVLVFDISVICNSDHRIYCVVLMKLNQNTAKLKDLTAFDRIVFCNNYVNQPLRTSTNS